MKVKELVEKLLEWNQDLEVVSERGEIICDMGVTDNKYINEKNKLVLKLFEL